MILLKCESGYDTLYPKLPVASTSLRAKAESQRQPRSLRDLLGRHPPLLSAELIPGISQAHPTPRHSIAVPLPGTLVHLNTHNAHSLFKVFAQM